MTTSEKSPSFRNDDSFMFEILKSKFFAKSFKKFKNVEFFLGKTRNRGRTGKVCGVLELLEFTLRVTFLTNSIYFFCSKQTGSFPKRVSSPIFILKTRSKSKTCQKKVKIFYSQKSKLKTRN